MPLDSSSKCSTTAKAKTHSGHAITANDNGQRLWEYALGYNGYGEVEYGLNKTAGLVARTTKGKAREIPGLRVANTHFGRAT